MKKIISFFIILFIILYNIEIKAYVAKNIDLQIKEGETSLVFIRLKNSTSILINEEEESNLFILDYKNDKGLKQTLKIFKSKPNIFYINKNINQKIDNIHIYTKNNILKLRINNYTLCINNNQEKINNCDFVYLINLNKTFEINQNLSAIFYDHKIKEEYLKNVQESWIDSSIVSNDSFTILKLSEDSYNIIVVPSTNN